MFANLKIARKLLIAFAVIIIAFLAAAIFILTSLAQTDRATAHVRSSKAATAAALAINHSFIAEQNAVRGFVIGQTEKLLADIEARRREHEEGLRLFRSSENNPELLAKITAVDALIREWRAKSADKQVALARDPATRAAASAFVNGQFAGKIQGGLAEIVSDESATTARYSAQQDRASARVNLALSIAGAIILALAVGLWWLLARSIATPVKAITGAMERLAAGEDSVAIPAIGRRDEVGQMAAALQVFRDAAKEKRRIETEAARAREQAQREQELQQRRRAELAAVQDDVVARLGSGLARLSEGDLVARLEEPFAPEYERIRLNFNSALQELHSAMQVILANTAGLRSGTHEITQAADDLARRTEQQAASLEQTAAALAEITSGVRKTAEGAEQARNTVSTARTDAERSGAVVQDAVAAMGEIDRSAKQISQIIGVIDEIAFQTNLLALNAGVEAARAGDAGRGFAVVASEVRALAQRSADAAKEIKTLISNSAQLVGRGVGLVDETGKSLSRIVSQVAGISDIVNEIAVSAQSQAAGLAEVNTAVNQMDQVTQQNAAMVEQSTAASHALAHEAEELAKLTARFRIAPSAPLSPPPQDRPARAKPPAARPQRPRAAVRGNTALATQHAPSSDDWEEF